MSEIVLTSDNFEEEVMKSDMPILVDFWATWCGPCQMVAPILSEIAKEYSGRIKVGKVNVDEQNALAAKFGVMSIPTMILFKNGEADKVVVGYKPKTELVAELGL